jgi:hypothetical protein
MFTTRAGAERRNSGIDARVTATAPIRLTA